MTQAKRTADMASQGIGLAHRYVGAFAEIGCDQHRTFERHHILSKMPAAPMPPPTHIVTRP